MTDDRICHALPSSVFREQYEQEPLFPESKVTSCIPSLICFLMCLFQAHLHHTPGPLKLFGNLELAADTSNYFRVMSLILRCKLTECLPPHKRLSVQKSTVCGASLTLQWSLQRPQVDSGLLGQSPKKILEVSVRCVPGASHSQSVHLSRTCQSQVTPRILASGMVSAAKDT